MVIAYDRLGHGQSSPRQGPLPINFVDDESDNCIPVIIDYFRLSKFILFGHSVGGGMAVVCAGKFPGRCAGVITESAQAFVEDRTLQGIREASAVFRDSRQIEKLRKYHGDKAESVLRAWTETWQSPDFSAWSLADSLARVKCPILAIHGDRDEFGSSKHPEMIAGLAGGPSRKIIIPGCGHVPHREKTEIILTIVSEFLCFDEPL